MTDRSAPPHHSWDDADPYDLPRHAARHAQPDMPYGSYGAGFFDRPAYEVPDPVAGPLLGQPSFAPPPFDPSVAPVSPKFSGFFGQWQTTPPVSRPVSPAPRPVSPAGRPVSPGGYPGRPVSPGGYPGRPVSPAGHPGRPVSPARPVSPGRAPGPAHAAQPDWSQVSPLAWNGARPTSPAPPAPVAWDGGWDNGRSHWVDGAGVDHRGNLVVDPDDVDYEDEEIRDQIRVNRRRALLALGGVVGSAAAAMSPQGLSLARKIFGGDAEQPQALSKDNLPGNGSDRPAGQQPSTVRTYKEQNDSYMGSTAGDRVRATTPKNSTVHNLPAQAAQAAAPPAPAAPQPVDLGPPPAPVAVSALGTDPIRHLASRVTFGATPKLIAEIERVGIDQWLGFQFEPTKIPDTRAEEKLNRELTTLNKSIDDLRASRETDEKAGINAEQEYIEATIARQIWSDRQLLEVMVDFWNDFLHVGPEFDGAEMQRAAFDRDVIRRFALDNYPDMLVAANHHPALINYLDQNQSRKDAVNENLARENLELYSVGVDGGYTELDVRQAALLQTGHSIRDDKYIYRPDQHFVGKVTIMGFTHENPTAAGGEAAAEQYYRFLAMHPSTANYIALNLCTRLVSDTPPQALVDQVAQAYLANGGKVKPMLATLLSSSAFWQSVGQKVRRPMEYVVATYRTLGVQPDTPAGFANSDANASPFLQGLRQIRRRMEELGHYPTGQPTPNGYPDVHVAWSSAGTMIGLWVEALRRHPGQPRHVHLRRPGADPGHHAARDRR